MRRIHIVISEQLAAQIDSVVGKRGRCNFFTQAAENELVRLRQIKALQAAAKWVKKLRREYDRRLGRVTMHWPKE